VFGHWVEACLEVHPGSEIAAREAYAAIPSKLAVQVEVGRPPGTVRRAKKEDTEILDESSIDSTIRTERTKGD
jgi:hypothetical protein